MKNRVCERARGSKPFSSNSEFLDEYNGVLESLCYLRVVVEDGKEKNGASRRGNPPSTAALDPDAVKLHLKNQKRFRNRIRATMDKGEVRLPLAEIGKQYELSEIEESILLASLTYSTDPAFERLMDMATSCNNFNIKALLRLFCFTEEEQTATRRVFMPSAPLSRNGLLTVGHRRQWNTMSEDDFLSSSPEVPFRISTMILGQGFFDSSADGSQRIHEPEHTLEEIDLPDETEFLVRRVVDFEKTREAVPEGEAGEETDDARIILLYGPSGSTMLMAAHAIAGMLGKRLLRIKTNTFLRKDFQEPEDLIRTLGMARLDGAIPCFTNAGRLLEEDPFDGTAEVFAEELSAFGDTVILIVNGQPGLSGVLGSLVSYPIPFPTPSLEERAALIRGLLPEGAALAPGFELERLAEQIRFTGSALKRMVRTACIRASMRQEEDRGLRLEDFIPTTGNETAMKVDADSPSYRTRARARLEDVVLPERLLAEVKNIIASVSARRTVFEAWGFGDSYGTGHGISALFYGPSGTGKTLTAEAIAGELDRPLRVVQLSGLVDKYVGETEKHIVEVFRTASASGEVLLFDEADAMFAARVDGSEHNSYYINNHINTILQEMDSYEGIVILSSNRELAMDKAFERRIRWKLEFPLPGLEIRESLWRKLMPAKAPMAEGLDFRALAEEFDFTGGFIRSTILKAAFEAASKGTQITQELLRNAARSERFCETPDGRSGIGFGATA